MAGEYITISGCHGTGKSTLVEMIGNKYNMIVIPETILSSPDKNFLSDNFRREVWFFLNYKRREELYFKDEKNITVKESRKKIKIADRWTNDIKIYCRAFLETRKMTIYEKDAIDMMLNYQNWTVPNLEIVITASDDEIVGRLSKRNNSKLGLDESDANLAKLINSYFASYAKSPAKENVYLVDTTGKSAEESCSEIEKILKKTIFSKK